MAGRRRCRHPGHSHPEGFIVGGWEESCKTFDRTAGHTQDNKNAVDELHKQVQAMAANDEDVTVESIEKKIAENVYGMDNPQVPHAAPPWFRLSSRGYRPKSPLASLLRLPRPPKHPPRETGGRRFAMTPSSKSK